MTPRSRPASRVRAAVLATLAALSTVLAGAAAAAELPRLVERDGRHALLVDGKPFLVLGAQFAEGLKVRGPQGQEQVLQTDGIFIEQALLPRSELVADLVELDLPLHPLGPPAQGDGPLYQRVLVSLAFAIALHLPRRRLADVDVGHPLAVLRGDLLRTGRRRHHGAHAGDHAQSTSGSSV